MQQYTLNMTQGHPAKLIVRFSLPLMLSNVFQQLYTVVDTAIVGKALGVDALAALGAADWLNYLMYGMVIGLTQGFAILVAQAFGAQNQSQLRRAIGSSMVLSALCTVVLLVLLHLAIDPVLIILQTPDRIMPGSKLYLRIMFSGIPIVMAYNLFASFLRSLGDGKTPLYAMVIASILNIVLDLLFVLLFQWGIAGAAVATLIAQLFAALFCLYRLLRNPDIPLSGEDFQLDPHFALRLLKLGSPMAVQNCIIAIGGMIVQFVVNGLGVVFIAGFAANNKLYGLLDIAAISYGYAMITYTGQNLGAGRLDRIRQGHRSALLLSIFTSLIVAAVMILSGKWILSCFLSGTPEEVTAALDTGYQLLVIMNLFLPALYVLYIERSCVQAMGNTVLPLVSGIAEFVMRTATALLLPSLIGDTGVLWAEGMAWIGADLILVPSYWIVFRKLVKSSKTSSLG